MDAFLRAAAQSYYRDAKQVMRVGDRVGPNDTELANALYAASSRLTAMANRMMDEAWAYDPEVPE